MNRSCSCSCSCNIVKIPDINFNNVNKENIQEDLFYHHYKDMKEEIQNCKNISCIKQEDFRKEQEYMNDKSIKRSRTQLKVRLEMVESFKDNYRSKYRILSRGEEDRDPGLLCGDWPVKRHTVPLSDLSSLGPGQGQTGPRMY